MANNDIASRHLQVSVSQNVVAHAWPSDGQGGQKRCAGLPRAGVIGGY